MQKTERPSGETDLWEIPKNARKFQILSLVLLIAMLDSRLSDIFTVLVFNLSPTIMRKKVVKKLIQTT